MLRTWLITLLMTASTGTVFANAPDPESSMERDYETASEFESGSESLPEEQHSREELNSSLENWEAALLEDESPSQYESAQLESDSDLDSSEERTETVTADEE